MRLALERALGSGYAAETELVSRIQDKVKVTWNVLPKSSLGLVDSRSLRFIVHRYFMDSYMLSIEGLDPMQKGNASLAVSLIEEHAPNYAHSMFEGEHRKAGFSLEDVVATVILLEQLVAENVHDSLSTVMHHFRLQSQLGLDRAVVLHLLEESLLAMLLHDAPAVYDILRTNRSLISGYIQAWDDIKGLASSHLAAFEHFAHRSPMEVDGSKMCGTKTWHPLASSFAFDDVVIIATSLTKSFGSYMQGECSSAKASLMALDTDGSGRVKLSKFYEAALDGEWRFSESKEYLKEIGALDESSSWRGPRVIIANYLQAANNCAVTTSHFSICCRNECEDHLATIEAALDSPTAEPEVLLALVSNLTKHEPDAMLRLSGLRVQLMSIAEAHHGKVPLHGRLFAQWLHYVFPFDCPFPHLKGTTSDISPVQFGVNSIATGFEMVTLVQTSPEQHQIPNMTSENARIDNLFALWHHEEELLSEHIHLQAPLEWHCFSPISVVPMLFIAMVLSLSARHGLSWQHGKEQFPVEVCQSMKSHFV